jgi:uncharacterized membrane protein HdeD (DUF308 family)
MSFLRPIVGTILVILGVLSLPHAFAASGQAAIQLWIFSGAYAAAAVLVFMGNEFGAWGAILVPTVTLVIVGAQVVQAPSEVEIPVESWLTVAANIAALVGGALLVRADKPTT